MVRIQMPVTIKCHGNMNEYKVGRTWLLRTFPESIYKKKTAKL